MSSVNSNNTISSIMQSFTTTYTLPNRQKALPPLPPQQTLQALEGIFISDTSSSSFGGNANDEDDELGVLNDNSTAEGNRTGVIIATCVGCYIRVAISDRMSSAKQSSAQNWGLERAERRFYDIKIPQRARAGETRTPFLSALYGFMNQ